MFQRRNLVVVGMVCAASALQALAQPTETEWGDGHLSATWDEADNWDFGVPDENLDALHTTDLSDIEVNIDTAACESLEGKGGSAVDRFMVLLGGKTLTSDGDVFGTTGQDNFVIKLQDGNSAGDPTKLVAGALKRIDLIAASSHDADFFRLDASGDVTESTTINVGNDADIDIGGFYLGGALSVGNSGDVDIVGDLKNVTVDLGALSVGIGETRTTVTIGSVGEVGGTNADWTLLGYVDVEIDDSGTGSGDFNVNASAQPTFRVEGGSTLVIDGPANNGNWIVKSNASLTVGNGTAEHFEPQELTVDG